MCCPLGMLDRGSAGQVHVNKPTFIPNHARAIFRAFHHPLTMKLFALSLGLTPYDLIGPAFEGLPGGSELGLGSGLGLRLGLRLGLGLGLGSGLS